MKPDTPDTPDTADRSMASGPVSTVSTVSTLNKELVEREVLHSPPNLDNSLERGYTADTPDTATGTQSGQSGHRPCSGCENPRRKELEAAFLAHVPLLELVSRFGGSKSSLSRHFKNHVTAAIIRAVARAAPPPDFREVEIYEDRLLAELLAMHQVTREELDAARKGPDKRLVVVLLGQLRENITALGKFLPASRESEPPIRVSFVFPPIRPARPEPEALPPAVTGTLDAATAGPEIVVAPPTVTQPTPLDANDPRPYDARIDTDSSVGTGPRRWSF